MRIAVFVGFLSISVGACGNGSTSSGDDDASAGTGSSSGGTGSSSGAAGSSSGGTGSSSGTSGSSSGASGSSSGGTPVPDAGKASRPGYNTGTGFFVLGGLIYDSNGNQFVPMGLDAEHWDWPWASCTSNCGIPNSGANILRFSAYDLETSQSSRIAGDMSLIISQGVVPLPGAFSPTAPPNAATSGDTSAADLASAAQLWVNTYALWAPYQDKMMLNIANEWGPTDSGDSAWATAYEGAIKTLRNAGYTCPLVIDSGSWGQDPADIIKYGAEVFDSDPQKNVIFSIHVYGLWGPDGATTNGQFPLDAELQQVVAAAAGKFPVILGEFGPQTTTGPSPTALTPAAIMQEADKLGLGWAAWAFDDTAPFDIAANPANPQFSLTNGKPTNGAYPNNTDLSAYGNSVILDPTYGLFTAAKKASIF